MSYPASWQEGFTSGAQTLLIDLLTEFKSGRFLRKFGLLGSVRLKIRESLTKWHGFLDGVILVFGLVLCCLSGNEPTLERDGAEQPKVHFKI
jgi:hypothetical protein